MRELLHTSLVVQKSLSAMAGRRNRPVRCAGCSRDLLPPSPPAEKATARQDQTWKSSTGDGDGDGSPMRCLKKKSVLTDVEGQHAEATSWRRPRRAKARRPPPAKIRPGRRN